MRIGVRFMEVVRFPGDLRSHSDVKGVVRFGHFRRRSHPGH